MPTSLNLLDLFSGGQSGYGATQTLDMTQPAFANTLAVYKTTQQQALIGFLSDIANSSINKDEFYNRIIFSYLTTILEAGLTPDPTNWTQQVDAIKLFAEKATVHDPAKTYKNGARVQNGFGGGWYEAVQDVPASTAITNLLYWQPASNFKIFNSDDVLTTGRALTADDINKHFIFNDSLPQTFSLPPVNSLRSGSCIYVRGGQSVATFECVGSDTINVNNVGAGVTSCTCFGSEAIMLVSNGGIDWRLTKINPRFDNGVNFTNATRPFNTYFTNTSGFSRLVYAVVDLLSPGARATLVVGNHFNEFVVASNTVITVTGIVPPGISYELGTFGSVNFLKWTESNIII